MMSIAAAAVWLILANVVAMFRPRICIGGLRIA